MIEDGPPLVSSLIVLAKGHRDITKDMGTFRNKGVMIIRLAKANQSLPQMGGLNIQERSGALKPQEVSEDRPYRRKLHLMVRQQVEGDDGEVLVSHRGHRPHHEDPIGNASCCSPSGMKGAGSARWNAMSAAAEGASATSRGDE